MPTIDEKRVYSDRTGTTTVLVASEVGLVRVEVSDDLVGEFGIARTGIVRDVASADGTVAVATDEDVLVDDEVTEFGPAVAVGVGDGPFAADDAGRVRRYDGDRWTDVGTVETVRAIDGRLLAAEGGVYRVGDDLTYSGLSGVRDVASAGVPLAATASGLFTLGNGWMDVLDGDFSAVASDGTVALAASTSGLYVRGSEGWVAVDRPSDDRLVDVGVAGGVTMAITENGTLLLDAGDGWRSHLLGVTGVRRLAVV